MPINPNRSASDYTTYLKQKSVAAVNTRSARLNDNPVPNYVINTALKTSEMSKIVNPTVSALEAPTWKTPQVQRSNPGRFAKATISWVNPGVT